MKLDPKILALAAARETLTGWAQRIWPDFETPPHVRRLIAALEAVERGEVRRLLVAMPPRHGKSRLSSVAAPSWFLGRNPGSEVMISSYSASLSEGFSRQARDAIVQHGEAVFGVKVSQDSRSVESWALDGHPGRFHSAGIGGSLTGKGADLLVIDDPTKDEEEAQSEIIREKTWNWFATVAMTRLSPKGRAIVTATRWHEADLIGRLLQGERDGTGEKWETLILPMVDDAGEFCLADGPILWESRFSRERVNELRRTLGQRAFEALYQQRPSNPAGNIFKRETLRFYKAVPSCSKVIVSVDTSYKATKSSDFSVVQVWGRSGPNAFLLDQARQKTDFAGTVSDVLHLRQKWKAREIYVEDKANGAATISQLKRQAVSGVIAVTPEGGKESRAHAVTPLFESGGVHLPNPALAPWISEFVEELLGFPFKANDDQVDAMTQALLRLMKGSGSGGYWDDLRDDLPRTGTYGQIVHPDDYRADHYTYRDEYTGEETDGWKRRI